MTLQLLSIGTAQPKHRLSQEVAAETAAACSCDSPRHHKLLPELYRRTTVEQRGCILIDEDQNQHFDDFYPPPPATPTYAESSDTATAIDSSPTLRQRMAQYEKHAPQLAIDAARQAIQQARISPEEITDLVTVSCTGFRAPGVDIELIQSLSLPPTTSRTHLGFMGCHGAMNGLRTANALANQKPHGHVLTVCVELCTLHFQYGWRSDRIVSNALFGDGAAAFVGKAQTTGHHWRLVDNFSAIVPNTQDLMTWQITDHGFEMYLSNEVPAVIEANLRDAIEPWLADHQLAVEDVTQWAIHPGGPRILSAAESALNLTAEDTAVSRKVLRECGNMSSPTILFIMNQLPRQQGPAVALAFGPGLTIEAALFD